MKDLEKVSLEKISKIMFKVYPNEVDFGYVDDELTKFAQEITHFGTKGYYSTTMDMFFEGIKHTQKAIMPDGILMDDYDYLYENNVYPAHILHLVKFYRKAINIYIN